jgi:hypothetical protein
MPENRIVASKIFPMSASSRLAAGGPRVSNDDAAIPEHRPRFGDLRLPIGAPTCNAKTPGLKLVDLRPPFGIAWFRLFYCLG